MPQLQPDPWFPILTFSWTVLLVVVPPKVLAHTFPAAPTTRDAETPEANPWYWSCP